MATTLQNLRDGVRVETRDPDGIYFQDNEIDNNINQAYRTTYQQVLNAIQRYFALPIYTDVTAATREYALPADHFRLLKIELIIGTTWVPLRRYLRGYAANYVGGVNYGINNPVPTYDIEGDNLVLEPTPRVTVPQGLRWTYDQTPIDLISPTDTIHPNFKDLWKDVIILRAAKACFGQMEAVGGIVSAGTLKERLEEQEQTLEKSLALRTTSPNKKRRKSYFQ